MESSATAPIAPETAVGLQTEARVFEVGSLLDRLQSLSDSRGKKGQRYQLAIVALFIILAKLSGQDRPGRIATWIACRQSQLLGLLHLRYPRVPHQSTYRRLLGSVIKPEELELIFSQFLKSLSGVGRSFLISLDGKTLCGTIDLDRPRGEHLLAAYLPEEGIVLCQIAAGSKENEIVVAPKVIETLDLRGDLRGKVVCGDAEQTQVKLSIQILEAGADYLWLAKDNQPTLRADIETLFESDDRTVLGGRVETDFRTFRTVDKAHGRLESRQITVSSELKGYSDWPGLEQVFKLERQRIEIKSGKEHRETVYGLTSLARAEASAKRLLYLSRTYWGIENGLHHRRDVTFQEDAIRLTRGKAGRVMAAINNLVIGLLRHTGQTNIAEARLRCDADLSYTLSLLTACPIT